MAHPLMLLREMGRRSILRILWSHNGFLNVSCEYAAWRVSKSVEVGRVGWARCEILCECPLGCRRRGL